MPRGPRKRDVTFYLVKDDVMTFEGVIPPQEGVHVYALEQARGFPFEGRLVVRPPKESPPWWVPWLRGSIPEVGNFLNASNAAVIALRMSGRLFAVTFGYGRSLMSLDAFERDFGLRVALNVVDPDSLNSVDAKTFEQLTVMTRSQTSRASSLESFRVSQAEDILKAVTGTPRDANFGARVTGADAVKVTYAPTLATLHEKCDQLLNAHRSEHYKERFGFIDDLRIVRDRTRVASLNQTLLGKLRDREFDVIHMAPPEITDVRDINDFAFDAWPDERNHDLDIERYCALVAAAGQEHVIDSLRKGKVGVTYRGGEEVHYLWTVFDCIVAEIREGERLFVLSGGTWYQVEGEFAERVAAAAEQRVREPEFLPVCQHNEWESHYNARVAGGNGLHLLHECMVRPAGARSPIEFADLLRDDGRIIHVKRRSRSSTLSHLFSQGMVSAEAFLRDGTVRGELSDRLRELGRHVAAQLIPAGRPTPSDWEVVYAVLDTGANRGPRSLPFFSQLNFKLAAERLESSGFRVSLRQIPIAA